MKNHSALPWRVTANPMRDDGVFITFGAGSRSYEGELPEAITPCQIERGNAEFIVKAVNHHDELVAVLADVADLLERRLGEFEVTPASVDAARELITKVKAP